MKEVPRAGGLNIHSFHQGEKPAVCPTIGTQGITSGKTFILQCWDQLIHQEESQNFRAGSNCNNYLDQFNLLCHFNWGQKSSIDELGVNDGRSWGRNAGRTSVQGNGRAGVLIFWQEFISNIEVVIMEAFRILLCFLIFILLFEFILNYSIYGVGHIIFLGLLLKFLIQT